VTRGARRVAIYPADLQGITVFLHPTPDAVLGNLGAALPARLAAQILTALLLGAE
jgi:hypothetical protein